MARNGYTEKLYREQALAAYRAILVAMAAADDAGSLNSVQFWMALSDLVEAKYPRMANGVTVFGSCSDSTTATNSHN